MSALEIIVNISAELPSYHDGKTAFGAHLAFKADSEASMLSLLELNKWKFHAYLYDKDAKTVSKIDISKIEVQTISSDRGYVAAQRIVNWLKSGRNVAFDKDQSSMPGKSIDPSQATAAQILQGSVTWPAPLPHAAQMTNVLRLDLKDGAMLNDKVLLLPLSEDEYSNVTVEEKVVIIPAANIGPKKDIVVDVKAILPLPTFDDPPEPIRKEDGFLNRSWSEPDYRFLRDLESQAGALVSTLPALLTLPQQELLKCDKAKLCKLGCVLALDSLLFALVSNGKTDREGGLLSPLVSLLSLTRDKRTLVVESLRATIKATVNELLNDSNLANVLFAPSVGTTPSNPQKPADLDKLAEDTKALYLLLAEPKNSTIETLTSEQVLTALNIMLSRLQSESGLEPVYLRMISWAIAKMGDQHMGLKDKFPEFVALVQGPFNAADAVRVDCGVLLAEVVVGKKKDAATLWSITKDLNLHANRINKPADVWNGLPDVSGLVEKPIEDQKVGLKKAWESLIARRLSEEKPDKSTRRFQPDKVPQSLPIPIATVPAGQDELNKLTRRFNGIAVLIRGENEKWAHANLVNLQTVWSKEAVQPDKPTIEDLKMRVVQPFLPVAVDGRREMFIPYNGVPLSSPAYSQTMAPSVKSVDTTGRLPFFTTRDADFNDKMLERPPRLAYGKKYEAIAYAVTKAGVLPSVLQFDVTKSPWLPKTPEDGKGPPDDQVTKVTYRRTTAIGTATIGTPTGEPQRIGAAYPDVYPLALDHPRLNVAAFPNKPGIFDLYRNSDGTGQLTFPQKGEVGPPVIPSKPTLFDLERCSIFPVADNVTVIVEVHSSENATIESKASKSQQLSPDQFQKSNWLFAIITHGDELPSGKIVLELDENAQPGPLWVRLRVQATSERNLSFSLPQQSLVASHGTMPEAPPVLLVSPSDSKKWSSVFHSAHVQCSFSRTTWRDWDYWFSNSDLEMYGVDRKQVKEALDNADKALLTASVMRGLDTDVAKLIDRLPDPAVAGFLIELSALETIDGNTSKLAPTKDVYWHKAQTIKDAFSNSPSNSDPFKFLDELKGYLEQVTSAFQRPFRIKCQGDELKLNISEQQIDIVVPSGVVAQLTVRPLVRQSGDPKKPSTFENAFAPEMKQLALTECTYGSDKYLVFEGASLTVESMYDAVWSPDKKTGDPHRDIRDDRYDKMLDHHVGVQTAAQMREYKIIETAKRSKEAEPLSGDLWKCFSRMDIRTQRWRFSGRPIYSWISPRHHLESSQSIDPCLELKRQDFSRDDEHTGKSNGIDELKTFENELFFDRDAADAEVTRVRLSGQMARHDTTDFAEPLQSFAWELPSATYFRHAFQLISRYSGALNRGGQGSPVWPPESIPWVRRVAILADATRLEITRPQVRCLVPLSSTPSASEGVFQGESDPQKNQKTPSPPVACILEEKPFAVGGLADRILAEIKTGIGYGFVNDNQKTVLPLDFGKETSRDGRISAWSWMPHIDDNAPDPSKSFILNAEGPIGLHFEQSETIAPTWVNCEYLLQPRSLEGGDLPDETFVAVQLRRVLAPDWVSRRPDAVVEEKKKTIDVFQSAVGTFDLAVLSKGKEGYFMKLASGDTYPVLEYKVTNSVLEVFVARKWIATTDTPDGKLTLCRIPPRTNGQLAIVHTQLADGLFHATVCVIPLKASVKGGTIKSYTPLASVIWSRPTGVTATELVFPTATDLSIVSASSQTTREWTRTAKNSGYIATVNQFGHSLGNSLAIRELKARITQNRLTFTSSEDGKPVWITTESAECRMPQFVQRRLVAVLTTRSKSIGRQIDLFAKACLFNGKEPTLPVTNGAGFSDLRLHEIEVPAAIVAYGTGDAFKVGGPLHRFQEAKIDTISTGGSDGARHFRVYCRLANSYESISAISSLSITLAIDSTENKGLVLRVPKGKGLRALELLFSADDTHVVCQCHLWDGTVDEQRVQLSAPVSKNVRAITVKIDSVELDSENPKPIELWADVSVLHSESSNKDREFDFSWLFSSISAEANQASTRTLPSEMARRTEAQARLISFSDPMPLRAS